MEGRKPIPILDPEVEARSRGSGPVITYQLSPEELARYRSETPKVKVKEKPPIVFETDRRRMEEESVLKSNKYAHITKEFLEAELAAGKSVSQIQREQGMPQGSLGYYMKKLEVTNPNSRPFGPPAAQIIAVSDNDKDAEIERLRNELASASGERNRLQEALEGAAFVATQSGARIHELEQERDDYKRAAEDLEAMIVEPAADLIRKPETEAEVAQLVRVIENPDRDVAQIRPSRTITLRTAGSQGEVEDELTAMLAYVQAMRGRSFKLELFLGEVDEA